MFEIKVRRQSIIDYYDLELSQEATQWIDGWLRGHDVIRSYDNPDFLEVQDPVRFKELAEESNPPEHIKDEVWSFFDICWSAYKRVGVIFIDFLL
jgi:hypothetical protein